MVSIGHMAYIDGSHNLAWEIRGGARKWRGFAPLDSRRQDVYLRSRLLVGEGPEIDGFDRHDD